MDPAIDTLKESGSSDDSSLEKIAYILEQTDFKEALTDLEQAQGAWERVDQSALSPWLAEKVALLEQGLPLLEAALKDPALAPELIGMEETRTYLVLAVNEDELRPGGGFISGVGEIHVRSGRIITMTFRDSYAVDDFSKPYPYPPDPIQQYMGIDQWVFRDSNWSPDFPTAAQKAIELYRPGYPVTIDGVISLDQHAVQAIVDAIGPISIEGNDKPITGDTLVSYIREAWAPESGDMDGWWGQRKAFMGTIASAAWQKVQGGDIDWIDLLFTSLDLLDRKHMLIYFTHPQAASLMTEQGWSGTLDRGEGDFLMIVDANMGYNKANANVQKSITYEVDLHTSPPQALLTLVYTHTSEVEAPCNPESRYDPTYEQMTERCYWHYLRIYAPEGSRLLDATCIPISDNDLIKFGGPVSGAIDVHPTEEGAWISMGVMGLLPLGETRDRYLRWELPSDVLKWNGDRGKYSLTIQKQPGTLGSELEIRVRLPQNSTLTDAEPKASMKGGEQVVYHTTLDRDRQIALQFRRHR
jgi:hypothetical protein